MGLAKLGIIPAAGKATRFGGVRKELLPADGGKSFLWHSYERLARVCEYIAVVTNADNIGLQKQVLGNTPIYIYQFEDWDIWGAIWAAIAIRADRYYFTMPDTYTEPSVFENIPDTDFTMGTFLTRDTVRYGVIKDGVVVNKTLIPDNQTYRAWGTLVWNRDIRDMWMKYNPKDYTLAINQAMSYFDWSQYPLEYYYDIARFDDYVSYIIERF